MTPKYEGKFSYNDYLDFVTPTVRHFISHLTNDPFEFLFDDEIDCSRRIIFFDPLIECPKSPPKESNPPPSMNPPESVTFKILKRRVPQFMQDDNPQSFHACFTCHGDSPSSTFSRFHPREDEDVDTSLPWRVPFEDDASIELSNKVSCREYINQRRKDQAKMEAMRRWGIRRRMLYEEPAPRRSPS